MDGEARIPIPIVGGIDDSTDPLALRPPNLAESENTRIIRKGAVSKRPAWGGILASATGSAMAVPGDGRVAVFGSGGFQAVDPSDGTLIDMLASPAFPVEVGMAGVAPGEGYVHSVQATASESYVCVVWSYLGTVADDPGELVESNFRVAGAILDADLRLVWGPHDMPSTLQWLPRVEAVGDGEFVVFGIGEASPAARDSLAAGALPELYAVRYDVDEVPASAGTVGTLYVGNCQLYDTSTTYPSDTLDAAIVAMNRYDGGTRRVRVAAYTTTLGTPTEITPAEADPHDVAVLWDEDLDTVLVYEGGDKLVHYADAAFSFASVAAPDIPGLTQAGATVPYTDPSVTETWVNRPVFYRNAAGGILLNEHPVTLTGSSPAVPSFVAAAGPERCLVYEPAALAGAVVSVRAALKSLAAGYRHGIGALDAHTFSGDTFLPIAPLAESRLGDPGHAGYLWQHHRANNSSDYSSGPYVAGQVAILGSSLALPMPVLTANQNVRGTVRRREPADSATARLHYKASPNAHSGAGFYNDEQTVALVTLTQSARTRSAVAFGDRTVLAAGGVHVWSGERSVQPICLRAPSLVSFSGTGGSWPDQTSAGREISTEAVGVRPDVTAGTGEVKFNGAWYAKAQLVVTDASGVQYRSPLSNRARGWTGANEDDVPTECPCFGVLPPPEVTTLLGSGVSVDVELFTTERAENQSATVGDIDESTYSLRTRMPLQVDENGYYVVDLMSDYARYATAGLGWGIPTDIPLRNGQPLYTLSDELEPATPPASGVVAQAGGYLFLVSSEVPREIWHSKPLVAGRVPEFSPLLSFWLPPEAGPCVSLGGTYDRLLAFTATGVYEIPAIGGPDATGDGAFPPARLLFRGDPCLTHNGTVSTPLGVFYVARSGPKLVGQDGGGSDIGGAVRDRVDWSEVVAAVYHEARHEVIWYTSDLAVVLHTETGAWSTHDLLTQDAVVSGGTLYRINQAGALRAEDPTSVLDGSAYPMATITTGWFDAGDPQGYKKLVEFVLLGRIENTPTLGKLVVELAYDYDDTVVDSFEWDWTEVLALATATKTFRLEVHPTQTKVDAVKLTVREDTTTVGQNTGNNALWTLANVEARVRGKSGLSKLPAESRR